MAKAGRSTQTMSLLEGVAFGCLPAVPGRLPDRMERDVKKEVDEPYRRHVARKVLQNQ